MYLHAYEHNILDNLLLGLRDMNSNFIAVTQYKHSCRLETVKFDGYAVYKQTNLCYKRVAKEINIDRALIITYCSGYDHLADLCRFRHIFLCLERVHTFQQ